MPIASAANRVYIHETIRVSVRHRQQYMEHFLSWGALARKLYGMRLVGVWTVNGSTHRWAEVIVLWEHDGMDGLAGMFSGEYLFLHDPELAKQDHYGLFWNNAPEGVVDTSGEDRLLAPTSYTPALADAVTLGLGGIGYLHETFKGPPGSMEPFLARFETERKPHAERHGLKLVGAYRSMLVNDSAAVAIWAIPAWKDWAAFELAQHSDPAVIAWRKHAAAAGIDWEGKILNAVAGNPLDTGVLL
jgi:hypothetical protein